MRHWSENNTVEDSRSLIYVSPGLKVVVSPGLKVERMPWQREGQWRFPCPCLKVERCKNRRVSTVNSNFVGRRRLLRVYTRLGNCMWPRVDGHQLLVARAVVKHQLLILPPFAAGEVVRCFDCTPSPWALFSERNWLGSWYISWAGHIFYRCLLVLKVVTVLTNWFDCHL